MGKQFPENRNWRKMWLKFENTTSFTPNVKSKLNPEGPGKDPFPLCMCLSLSTISLDTYGQHISFMAFEHSGITGLSQTGRRMFATGDRGSQDLNW